MKEFSRMMSLCMGVIMSLCLSTAGLLSAGAFSIPSLLLNFVISFTIIRVIDRFINVGKLSNELPGKLNVDPDSLLGRLLKALVGVVVYSPMMTAVMVYIGYFRATSHGARIKYLPMLLNSLPLTLVLSFLICFFITPLLEKIIWKRMNDKQ